MSTFNVQPFKIQAGITIKRFKCHSEDRIRKSQDRIHPPSQDWWVFYGKKSKILDPEHVEAAGKNPGNKGGRLGELAELAMWLVLRNRADSLGVQRSTFDVQHVQRSTPPGSNHSHEGYMRNFTRLAKLSQRLSLTTTSSLHTRGATGVAGSDRPFEPPCVH